MSLSLITRSVEQVVTVTQMQHTNFDLIVCFQILKLEE